MPQPRSAKYPVVLSNRTIARTVRRTQPLTQNPHPRRPTPRIVSYSITRSIRGTQIPIARDEPPSSPFPRFPPLEVFRRRPPMRAPPLPQRPASENLHRLRHPGDVRCMTVLPPKAEIHPRSCYVAFGRVEDGRGNLGHAATLRFPSPLIEPDVPISGIRLSDGLHREAHGEKLWPQASSVQQLSLLRLTIQLSLKGPDHSRCLQAHRQSPSPRHLRKHTRSQGPSLCRHYPASMLIRPCPTPAVVAACRDVEAATL